MKLTPKQSRFIEEYFVDFNATRAAIRAGYSPRTARVQASQNLTKLNIRSKIYNVLKLREQQIHYDSSWIIESLKGVINKAMSENDHHAAIKALHLLGKHIGMFTRYRDMLDYTEQIQPVVVHITQMTDQKLDRPVGS